MSAAGGSLPLSKVLDAEDLGHEDLRVPLLRVDPGFRAAAPQHPMRRWEYAMAVLAIQRWWESLEVRGCPTVLDVGGAGSPLPHVLRHWGLPIAVVDPSINTTLEGFLQASPTPYDVVTCVSVIEHVPAAGYEAFVEALARAVAPGGLLFLTTDYAVGPPYLGNDKHHFWWMRERIYDAATLLSLARRLEVQGLEFFGGRSYLPGGRPEVYDYTFASVCMTRPR